MGVVREGKAVEQQQLEVGQRPIGQQALLPGMAGPERAQPQGPRLRIKAAVAHNVGPGRVVQQVRYRHQALPKHPVGELDLQRPATQHPKAENLIGTHLPHSRLVACPACMHNKNFVA